MVALGMALAERGVTFIPSKDIWGDEFPGNVAYARGCLLYRIADTLDDGDWVWWQDADVSIAPDDVLDLLRHDQDIVVRAYPLKLGPNGEQGWSITPKFCDTGYVWHEEKQIIEIHSSGFGAVLMKPGVARKMRFACDVIGLGPKRIPAFDFTVDDAGREMYEDASFFRRWAGLGETAWCAPDAPVGNGGRAASFYQDVMRRGG
jgi:hypothetical protein